ncbi:hypothetical protein RhiirB3_391607 [Rhizophagus irregularis]|nr:hypothetical protein RhiirB3_391607 [Rhizophagus irregularis]
MELNINTLETQKIVKNWLNISENDKVETVFEPRIFELNETDIGFQSDCNLKVKRFQTGTWNFKMGFGLELNIKDRFRTETWNSRQVNVWKKEAGFGSYTRMFATLLTFFIISFLRF